MKTRRRTKGEPVRTTRPRHVVRLPGFITDDQIGLGDVIKRVSSWAGIKPCGSCERRADFLNSWIAFTGSQRR